MHGKVSQNFSILFQVDQTDAFCLNNGYGEASYQPRVYTTRAILTITRHYTIDPVPKIKTMTVKTYEIQPNFNKI